MTRLLGNVSRVIEDIRHSVLPVLAKGKINGSNIDSVYLTTVVEDELNNGQNDFGFTPLHKLSNNLFENRANYKRWINSTTVIG